MRRRAAYARTQQSFKNNRKRSARDVLAGVLVGESRVNSGAFADDIAPIARTPRGLQFLFDGLATEFRLCGMEKMWIVNPYSHLLVFRQPVPAINILEIQRYLGVPLSRMRTRADVAGKLKDWLREHLFSPP